MARFTRSAYGANPHEGRARNVANGWTGVWPRGVPAAHLGQVNAAGVSFPLQRRLVPLAETLLEAMEAAGYDVRRGQTWGYANRPIRRTRVPSNHSRAKAVDINSTDNPMQPTFRSDIPPDLVGMWEDCGWYWGGRYSDVPDPMHFEYLGKPSDVEADLAKAKGYLARFRGDTPPADGPAPTGDRGKTKSAGPKLGRDEIRRGDRHGDVGVLQRFVGVDDDGIFGPATEKAVRRWQMIRGYQRTGVLTVRQGAIIRDALG